MIEQERNRAVEMASGAKLGVIDCDIHEIYTSASALLPYLEPHWAKYITDYGWTQVTAALPQVYPVPGAGYRSDWTKGDSPAGSDLDKMREDLFGAEGVNLGILCGFVHVSASIGQYEFMAAIAKAYNDWQVEHWLDREPRLRGSIHIVAHDPAVAAREIDRMAENRQAVQVFLPAVNNREYGDPMYRPIFEAAVRHGLAVALHHGAETQTALGYMRTHVGWHALAPPQTMMAQLTGLIFNGTFDKYPTLKVVIQEAGITWLPHLMWRLDQQYRFMRVEVPWMKRLPSEIMRDQVRVTTQPIEGLTKAEFLQLIDQMGTDRMLMFSTDYPHFDADSPSKALPAGLPDELRARIMHLNAEDTFSRL